MLKKTDMIWYLAVFLYCHFLSVVYTEDVMKIKKEIRQKEEYSKLLEQENSDLEKEIKIAREECESELRVLKQTEEKRIKELASGAKKLEELVIAIQQKQKEETLLNKALSREYDIETKYLFKVELYRQELEFLGNRKKNGVAEKCHTLGPLFTKFESSATATSRSSAPRMFRNLRTNENAKALLRIDLNKVRLTANSLKNRNEELKSKLNMDKQQCKDEQSGIKSFLKISEKKLYELMEKIDMFERDLKYITKVVEDQKVKLREFKEKNEKLRLQAQRMKDEKSSYAVDIECYKKVSLITVDYK